jgi:probable HAF family extracellular repeat protein
MKIMLHSRRYRLFCVLAVLSLLPVREPAFTADTYTVVDVATLGEAGGGTVRGLNAAGEVVGTFRSQSGKRGFRVGAFESPDSVTKSERLDGFFGTDGSAANAINPQGAVAGASNTATGIRAFLWTRNSGFRDLGALPGDAGSEALGINRHDEVVGYSSGPNGIEAVLWESNGNIQRLGQLRFGDYSRAYAVNDSGDVVGTSGQTGSIRAFLWTRNSQMEDLGALAGNDQCVATGINNSGRVVGYSSSGSQGDRAFLWSRNNGMESLGTLPGGDYSRALAINEPGDVVGVSDSPLGNRAVLWTRQGEMLDLNTLIPPGSDFVLTEAVSINNQGQILATGESGQAVSKQGHDHSRNEAPTRVVLLVP